MWKDFHCNPRINVTCFWRNRVPLCHVRYILIYIYRNLLAGANWIIRFLYRNHFQNETDVWTYTRKPNYSYTTWRHITNRIPYLGMLFSSNGSFHQAQLTLVGQANKAVYMLYRKLSKCSNLKPDFMLDLFDKFIAQILNYGCDVWGFHPAPNIELIALRFYKKYTWCWKSIQNDYVYKELGRTPMIMRHIRIIKYLLNIVMGNKSPYVARLYHFFMRQAHINNKPSWVRSVKTLLSRTGFGDVWVNQGVEDIEIFMNILKQRLFDTFRQEAPIVKPS